MIRNIKNCKILLITFSCLFFLLSCSDSVKNSVSWIDLTDGNAKGIIKLSFLTKNKTTYLIKLKCLKSTIIGIDKDSVLYAVEYPSDFCLKIYKPKIKNGEPKLEIYSFPTQDVLELGDKYILKKEKNVIAYFVEIWDETLKRNYYILSKDNIIDKQTKINDSMQEIDKTMMNLDEDTACYCNDEQKFPIPYNGYVVKSPTDGSYVLLETLWNQLIWY